VGHCGRSRGDEGAWTQVKRYGWKFVRTFQNADNIRRKPMPFAGACPTRFAVQYLDADGRRVRWAYLGKPSLNLAQKIMAIAGGQGYVVMYEFDRAGVIANSFLALPRTKTDNSFLWRNINSSLQQFYHPWTWQDCNPMQTFRMSFSKRIRFNGKVYSVYSPYETLKIAQLHGHKEWLATKREAMGL